LELNPEEAQRLRVKIKEKVKEQKMLEEGSSLDDILKHVKEKNPEMFDTTDPIQRQISEELLKETNAEIEEERQKQYKKDMAVKFDEEGNVVEEEDGVAA